MKQTLQHAVSEDIYHLPSQKGDDILVAESRKSSFSWVSS